MPDCVEGCRLRKSRTHRCFSLPIATSISHATMEGRRFLWSLLGWYGCCSLWRSATSNKPLECTGHNQLSSAPPQTPCLPLRGSVNQPISLDHHRLQHIQNRHHLPLRLPEECVSYAWIKAAESFEQLAEMGFQLWADRQD